MNHTFNERVVIGDGSWISSFFAAILFFLFFAWPAMVWENAFVGVLAIIGGIILYLMPIILCTPDIEEHAEIKKLSEISYTELIEKYKIKHPSKTGVILLIWLLGWTIIGWFIALYLAKSRQIIDLPAGFIRELNELQKHLQPASVNVTNESIPAKPQAIPPPIVRSSATCKSCGANNTLVVSGAAQHSCEFCGGILEMQSS